jgi:hypothetical protein
MSRSTWEKILTAFLEPDDESFDALMKVGGLIGAVAGILYGFNIGGLGGSIVGVFLGGLVGAIGLSAIVPMVGRVVLFLLAIGILAVPIWIISMLWGVGK